MPKTRRPRAGRAGKPGPRRGPRPRRAARTPRVVLILAAYPRRAAAERAARLLVRGRVLACATVTAPARAFYFWEGREVAEAGALLYGKTTAARAGDAVRGIRENHPDRVPEILVLSIATGEPGYLAWVAAQVARR